MTDLLTRRAARFAAGVLGLDALLHVYWLTGATWPLAGERALSLAVLGFPAPFTPPVLVPLILLLGTAAVLICRGVRPAALVVAVAAAVQVPPRIAWAAGLGSPTSGRLFEWLNILVYLPACVLLALAAFRVARPRRRVLLAAPVVLAVLATGAAYLYEPGTDRFPATGDPRSRFVDTPVARFHYVREGSGPPLVLLPGGTASVYDWEPQLAALAATRTVYVVDLPGQGYTEPHRDAYDLPAMEDALGAFLDAAGLGRVDLGGHSWSGGWALTFAQSHPERVGRLVLLDSSGLAEPDVASWEVLKTPIMGELLVRYGYTHDAVRTSLDGLFVHRDRITAELVEQAWRPLAVRANRRSVYELERGLDWHRTQDRLPATTQETLIVWGAQDTTLPARQAARLAELLPHAHAHVLEGCGHAITLDCPGEVTDLMKAFLT